MRTRLFLVLFVLAAAGISLGCNKTPQVPTVKAAEKPAPAAPRVAPETATDKSASAGPAKPEPPPTADSFKGRWRNLGISGSDFEAEKGYSMAGEGGQGNFRLLNGEVWQVDFEADYRPLDQRWVYLAHISSDTTKGCGTQIGSLTSVPEGCMIEKKVLTFQGAKRFLTPRLNNGARYMEILRQFYQRRQDRRDEEERQRQAER
jgi:hypothetical protein